MLKPFWNKIAYEIFIAKFGQYATDDCTLYLRMCKDSYNRPEIYSNPCCIFRGILQIT